MKTSARFPIWVIKFVANYFRGMVYVFLSLELFAAASVVLLMGGMEDVITAIAVITPGMSFTGGNFQINTADVVIILTFWGLVINLLREIIYRVAKINIFIRDRDLFVLITALHVLLMAGGVLNMGSEFIPLGWIFYTVAMISAGFYTGMGWLVRKLEKLRFGF